MHLPIVATSLYLFRFAMSRIYETVIPLSRGSEQGLA